VFTPKVVHVGFVVRRVALRQVRRRRVPFLSAVTNPCMLSFHFHLSFRRGTVDQNTVSLKEPHVLSVGIDQSVYWLNEQWIGARFRGMQDSLTFSRAHQASSDATEGPLFETRPAYEADLHLIPRLGLRGTISPPTIHLRGMMPN